MMFRSLVLASSMLLATPVFAQDAAPSRTLTEVLEDAERLEPLETVIVSQNGEIIAERGYNGHRLDAQTNIKSASKTIISALIGIAIEKGILESTDQKIAPILRDDLPSNADPRIEDITIGNLLTMRAGLEPTSGVNYGGWVASDNWVRAALARPFVDDPGAGMLYSTGSSHLLSAILTQQTGRSTLANAREWLGAVPGFAIASWDRDPQGIYLGGNQMAMTPRSLLAFGELYRNGGLAPDGTSVISQAWIDQSWSPHTRSIRTGDSYGYGWFLRNIGGEETRFAWGFGGQMLYIVPALDLTVVMTSDETTGAANTGHRDDLQNLLAEIITTVRDAE